MAHNEARGHWLKEGAIGLSTGILYGVTSVAGQSGSITLPAAIVWVSPSQRETR